MSVQLFFQTHGRFPTQDEFRLLRTFRHHQPDILSVECLAPSLNLHFAFVHAARHGRVEEVQRLLGQITHVDAPALLSGEMRQTPPALCAAAQGDNINIIALLLDNKASVDSRPPQNRTALLFASESGHFNSMNFLISRGATYFTYSDQQIESYYMSYTIRQSITRRELSYILPGDLLPGIVLDYLGLGGHRTRPIERLAPVSIANKSAFGAKPIPAFVVNPIPSPHPCPNLSTPCVEQRHRTDGIPDGTPLKSFDSNPNPNMSEIMGAGQVESEVLPVATSGDNAAAQNNQTFQQQQHPPAGQ